MNNETFWWTINIVMELTHATATVLMGGFYAERGRTPGRHRYASAVELAETDGRAAHSNFDATTTSTSRWR